MNGVVSGIKEDLNEPLEFKDSVLVHFGPFSGLDTIHEVDVQLYDRIPLKIGCHDGHEVVVDDSHGGFFTYGQNAGILYKLMIPVLDTFTFLDNATVELNFYKPNGHHYSLEVMREKVS